MLRATWFEYVVDSSALNSIMSVACCVFTVIEVFTQIKLLSKSQ